MKSTTDQRSMDLQRLNKSQLINQLLRLEDKESTLAAESIDEYDRAIHELQVHQIELEMQNRELRESQHMLEQSRSRYLALYDFSPTGFCTLDSAGIVLEANSTAAMMLGSPRECLRGQSFVSKIANEQKAIFRQHLRDCLRNKTRPDFEVNVYVGAVARAYPLQILMKLQPSGDTSPQHVYMALIDAKARSAFASKLQFLSQTSDELAQTLDLPSICKTVARLVVPTLGEASRLSVFADDSQHTLLSSDKPVYASEYWQRRLEPYFAATGLDNLDAMQQMALQEKKIVTLKSMTGPRAAAYIKNKDAQRVLFDANVNFCTAVPLLIRDKVVAVLTVIRGNSEVTSAESFEEDLLLDYARRAATAMDSAKLYALSRRQTDARSKLLAIVSHDLRSPLSTIVLKAQMLQRKAGNNDAAYICRCAAVVLAAAGRMDGLIGDLLDVASMDSGQFSVQQSPMALFSILRDAYEASVQLAQEKNISVKLTLPNVDLQILCDGQRVLQVIGNLVGNAIKFTEHGGNIVITATYDQERACIGVSDDGPGMSAATMQRVFEGFWQANETAHLGKGLGLAICKGIVEASGGRMWTESSPGHGSTFYFTLQLASQPKRACVPKPTSRGRRQAKLDSLAPPQPTA